jgi:hypothetical protein
VAEAQGGAATLRHVLIIVVVGGGHLLSWGLA